MMLGPSGTIAAIFHTAGPELDLDDTPHTSFRSVRVRGLPAVVFFSDRFSDRAHARQPVSRAKAIHDCDQSCGFGTSHLSDRTSALCVTFLGRYYLLVHG
jgi:hypothetical protein